MDWKKFDEKIKNSPDHKYPIDYLRKKIDTDSWKNIPLPLCEVINLFKDSFALTSNIIRALVKENKIKGQFQAQKLKHILTT